MYLCTEALYYQIYGLTLRTNQPLPILIPTSTTTTADVEVNLVEGLLSHQDKTEDQQYPSGWYTQQKADGVYYCLSIGGSKEKLDVEIAPNGKQIWINWINLPLTEVTAILIGCIIGTALRLQGKICLHSSVIKVDNCAIGEADTQGCIAIIGAKGAGKSTTAAALAKQGYPILADDIAVLTDCGDSFLVQPGYPRLRLWKSAVNALYGDEKGLSRVFSQNDKHFLELNQDSVFGFSLHSGNLSPTRREALKSLHSVVEKGVGGLGHHVKNQDKVSAWGFHMMTDYQKRLLCQVVVWWLDKIGFIFPFRLSTFKTISENNF